jgi:hypothetical protein
MQRIQTRMAFHFVSHHRYTIPIAEAYLKWRSRAAETEIYGTPEPAPRALLIFPTKVRRKEKRVPSLS